MSYNINYTDTVANPTGITVEDQSLNNTDTDLVFVGKNFPGYAQFIGENFLHLLENFANNSAPSNPVPGQLWYDKGALVSPAKPQLRVWNGTSWTEAGNVKKAIVQPQESNSIAGDLWVDSINQQLYLFTGTEWVLVGPQFNSSTSTGFKAEEIIDRATDTAKIVISVFLEDQRVAIFSKFQFIPKSVLSGFPEIKQGITLSTQDFDLDGLILTKFWGTSEKADSLVVGNATVPAANFLRSDVVSTTNFTLNVRTATGVNIGQSLETSITSSQLGTILNQKTLESNIRLRLGPSTDVLVATKDGVSINKGGLNPGVALDVGGNVLASGTFRSSNISDYSTILPETSSIYTAGGAGIAKSLYVGTTATIRNRITVGTIVGSETSIPTTTMISPGTDAAFDIGSSVKKFRNVYAKEVQADTFTGTFVGLVSGSVSGTATSLLNARTFSITGDISAPAVGFNGTGNVVLNATLGDSLISSKESATSLEENDSFLVFKPTSVAPRLRKVDKATLFRGIASVPVGSIMPYAGDIPPEGFLFCDGSEQRRSSYSTLFSIIGFKYRSEFLLTGLDTFALPDLRGRFPLGREIMDNGNTVNVQTRAFGAERLEVFANAITATFIVKNNPPPTLGADGTTNGPFQTGRVVTDTGLDVSLGPAVITEVNINLSPAGTALPGFTTIKVTCPPQPGAPAIPPTTGLILNSVGVIDGGGGIPSPSRVSAATAIGIVGGATQKTLTVEQLPQHSHTLRSNTNSQYYAYRDGAATGDESVPGNVHTIYDSVRLLPNTGNINTTNPVGQPIDITNPFLTINYIIYAGV
jgi:microcystin-dependent protein